MWGTLNCLNEPFNKFRQGDSLIRGSLTLILMLEVLFIIGLVFQPKNSFWDLIFFFFFLPSYESCGILVS